MERDELKKILIEMGINETLTRMPGVIEPIYKYAVNMTSRQLRESDLIKVLPNGDFTFSNKRFAPTEIRSYTLQDDGTVLVKLDPNQAIEVTILLNEYGIEVSYFDGDEMYSCTRIKREEGTITRVDENNSTATSTSSTYLDNGSWAINEPYFSGYKVEQYRNSEYIDPNPYENFNKDLILSDFNDRANYISGNYPDTKQWYEQTRKSLIEQIDKHNVKVNGKPIEESSIDTTSISIDTEAQKDKIQEDDKKPIPADQQNHNSQEDILRKENEELKELVSKLESDISNLNSRIEPLEELNSELEAENSRLQEQNSDLTSRYNRLASMLETSLNFIGDVKKSPLGKIFFNRKIKDYENETRGLPASERDDDAR